MAENLKVAYYTNGDPIPNITGNAEWQTATEGAYCFYENNPEYEKIYGNLYNWQAVNDNRDICPDGWHVPSDEEWINLEL